MSKLRAIIRREYVQGVRSKAFIISTVLGPFMLAVFMIVPGLLFGLKTGGATRLAIVDQTGRMYESVREAALQNGDDDDKERAAREAISGAAGINNPQLQKAREAFETSYRIEEVALDGRAVEAVKAELNKRVLAGQLDAYVVLPPDLLQRGEAQFYGRNLGDMITISRLRNRLSRAVIEQRMRDENIDHRRVGELSKPVSMTTLKVVEGGEERDSGGSFFLAVGVGTFILIAILMYGQTILSAVVEEKSTRIVEVLFSSVRSFTLMMGKLVGVALLALTQYAIWAVVSGVFLLYGASVLDANGIDFALPNIPLSFVVYAPLYFLLGFFLYATIYAVVGAIVTTEKEAGQIVIPISFMLASAIYMSFPVIRSPNSGFSFWVSMIPFFSPVTMLVRIVTETPPFWQIALSLAIGIASVVAMVWLAARIYRTGMLMHGKRATIPEILRWVRQS